LDLQVALAGERVVGVAVGVDEDDIVQIKWRFVVALIVESWGVARLCAKLTDSAAL